METIRDIAVIVFSVMGTVTSIVLLIACLKFYGRASLALEEVGRASMDLHEAAEGVRGGVRLAKGALEVLGPVLPGQELATTAYRTRDAFSPALRFASRIKKPRVSNHKWDGWSKATSTEVEVL